MLIVTIRTDSPKAELGLYEDARQLSYLAWHAHRELAESIHLKLKIMLTDAHTDLQSVKGIVIFKGPGSFTGLRIGVSVANALSDALNVHIIGESGDQWLQTGITRMLDDEDDKMILPEYGADPHITLPRK